MRTAETTYMRLVIGRRALTTAVQQVAEHGRKILQLQASVPLDAFTVHASVVALTVQALNSRDEILDSCTFGAFHYSPPLTSRYSIDAPLGMDSMHSPLMHPTSSYQDVLAARQSLISSQGLGSESHTKMNIRASSPPKRQPRRSNDKGRRDAIPGTTYQLELQTPLESMAMGWDEDELAVSRRLVRFTWEYVGSKIKAACVRVPPGAIYDPRDTVISCIYRADEDACCVTSVDVLLLLERLSGRLFDVDEKNRIRRNLEGLRPRTVSKSRADSRDFFELIMRFPPPRPRNIEKDVKVFNWAVLTKALEKVISRYTVVEPSLKTTQQLAPVKSEAHVVHEPRSASAALAQLLGRSAEISADPQMPTLLHSDAAGYFDMHSVSSAASTPTVATPTASQDLTYRSLAGISHNAREQVGVTMIKHEYYEESVPWDMPGLASDSYPGMNALDPIEFLALREYRTPTGTYS